MKQNAFKQQIPEIKEVLDDKKVCNYIRQTLNSVLDSLGVNAPEQIVEQVLSLAKSYGVLELDYEQEAHVLLEKHGVNSQCISEALSGRAELIVSQIEPYLTGNSVLDLGCGDGKVGEKIAEKGLEAVLADIYRHNNIDNTDRAGLRFIPFKQGEDIPEQRMYDNTLLLTVMHHSDDPIHTLLDAKKRTNKGGRIIIIESVYGIDGSVSEPEYGIKSAQITHNFKGLTTEQQRMANIFFDHFYNRVIHYSKDASSKVNVPFNFRKPSGDESWEQIFKEHDLRQIAMKYLGIDQPTVPEYHTLHVLKV